MFLPGRLQTYRLQYRAWFNMMLITFAPKDITLTDSLRSNSKITFFVV